MNKLSIKTNELNLTPTESKLFYLSMGEAIANFYQDPNNLASFEKEEENLKKEIESLEVKRSAIATKNGTTRISS